VFRWRSGSRCFFFWAVIRALIGRQKLERRLQRLAGQTGELFPLRQRKRQSLTLRIELGVIRLATEYGQEPETGGGFGRPEIRPECVDVSMESFCVQLQGRFKRGGQFWAESGRRRLVALAKSPAATMTGPKSGS